MSSTEGGNEFSEVDLRDDVSVNGLMGSGSLEEANREGLEGRDGAMLPLKEEIGRAIKPQTLGLSDGSVRLGESAEETFARLESEVVHGNISGRELVNSVLYVLVGGQFDMENAFVLREGHNVRLMINLLDKCPSHLQAEVLSVFIGIARRSNRNLEKCLENDLIGILLERLPDASDIVADLLIELLTVLATYSVNVKDMNAVLRYLRASNKRWPCHSVKLLVVVKQMMRKDGPDIFFSLSGHPNSGIHIPPLSRWPYQNGWSFVTWLRLDPETSGSFEEDMPYLFSFRTRSGLGHSCHFVGGCMVLTTSKSKGGQSCLQQCIKYEFQLRRWYHVALAYSFSRWGRSEVHCYINGQRTSTLDLNWHVNTNEQYDRCFVGCSPDTGVRNSFSGQLGALYLFSETLSLQQVNSLYYLGPSYQSCFKFKNEVDIPSAYLKYLFDGRLANSLVFAYCPKNCDRQLCLNSVNKENQVHFRQTTHAVMMDGVRVVVTHSIYTSLHSVGGIQILLPLLSQLDFPVLRSDGSGGMDYLISSVLLSIFSQLLQSSPDIRLQMLQSNAFLVIGVALTVANKAHITESVLQTLIEMAQFLMAPSTTSLGLLRQLFDYVLLNPDLWINADGKLQTRLYGFLATDFFHGARIFNPMRRVTTVMQLLHALKFYYWVTDPLSRSGVEAKGKDGPRPSVEQIVAIRTYILTLLFKIIVKDEPNAQGADEVEAILNFLTTVHEDDNLTDVLQTLIRLMAENPATLVPTFDKKKGVWVVFKLIGADGEMVRLLALKLLGFFLCRCTAKRKQEAMTPHNLYTLLVDRLLLHATFLNIRTYNVLFELLTENMTVDILDGRHKEPDTGCSFENPMIIKAIASLLHQSKENEELLEVKRTFLTDLIHMCSSSKENRRSILQMSVWQDWLISLTSLRPKSPAEHSILKLVYQLFSTLLHHAIRLEFGGWRVWIDTMAIIHSKASFENFCLGSTKAATRSHSAVISSEATVEQEVYHLLQDLVRNISSSVDPNDHQVYKIGQSNDMLDSTTLSQRFGAASHELAVPLYRIPEFRWSPAHLTLLSDLLLSIETDIAAWKNDGSRTLIDFINQSDNAIFVVNSVHVISQSLDNFIVACGGLLPLLAALTSPNTDLDIVDTTSQGLPVKVAISFLIRLANLTDVIVFGTACNFADLEHEKNMPNGGMMRQILRLVTTVAVRNCLVSHYRTCFDSDELVVSVKDRAIKALVDDLASAEDIGNDFLNLRSSIQDPERVLQEVDVYRLKAAVYRDIEESRQCQFLALATVYFISVLMVSRYRDILEPPSSPSPFHNTGMAGSNWDQVDKRSDKSESIGEQSGHETTVEAKAEVNGEAAQDITPSVDTFDDLTDSICLAAEANAQKGDKSGDGGEQLAENHAVVQDKAAEGKNSFNRERQALLTARLRNALEPVAPLFREIISDFQSYFQKTLLGTHGQEIMNDQKVLNTLRNPSVSVVELVMLLCSQEWQTSLQKHAGLAFIELVNEGRLLAHATRDHLVRVANEAEYILNRIRAEDVVKHAEFEALCAQAVVTCKEEENTCNLLLSAARRRNVIISRRILQKIVNILNSDYSAWGGLEKNRQYWTLDLWEDDSRRRKRLIPNPYGSAHPEATLKAIVCHGMDGKEVENARDALASYLSGKNIALPSLTPSSASDELVTESEIGVWAEDKEAEQSQHGSSCLITPCYLIAPGLALPGILSVTANEVAFDAKEDDLEFKQADPQVGSSLQLLRGGQRLS
uniref:BEACH-type PH domain-containing protein n=1 Tax=Trichuris muris TaxID=70415 RepID=A0A5S6QKT8_TRIMR